MWRHNSIQPGVSSIGGEGSQRLQVFYIPAFFVPLQSICCRLAQTLETVMKQFNATPFVQGRQTNRSDDLHVCPQQPANRIGQQSATMGYAVSSAAKFESVIITGVA